MAIHESTNQSDPGELLPRAFMFQIWRHVLLARALGITAELGIADLVADSPKNAGELATATGAHAESLYRVLRMLASHEVFVEDDQGRFHLTPRAAVLQTEHDESVRAVLRLAWQDVAWDTLRQLPHAVMTGEAAFDHAFGMPQFDYMAKHPDVNAAYDASMAVVSGPENAVIAQAYDFGQFTHVVDVAGGRGGLLAAVLHAYPMVQGILYEQPQVVAEPTYLRNAGLLERCDLIGGEGFFASIPQGWEVYTLKRIIHDWDDTASITILQQCRKAMAPEGRILVIDGIVRPGNAPDPIKDMDVMMLALHRGGRERTEAEFRTLFQKAELQLARVIPVPLPSTLSIIEGVHA
jgi:hypothetical protein